MDATATLENRQLTERRFRERLRTSDVRRFTLAVVIGWALVLVPYLWILTDLWQGGPSFFRTVLSHGRLSNFYDLQARALLHGHLYLPKGALGEEAFIHDGHQYMYFGLFPALLRVPFVLFTHSLDGRLTAFSILAAWIVTGVFSALLFWRSRMLIRGPVALGYGEATMYGFLFATIMGGSILLNLAANPWVYSEDIAWSSALMIATLFALLGVLEAPSWKRVTFAGVLILAVNLTRGNAGYGCVIGALLASGWFALGRGGQDERRWWGPMLLTALIPLAVSIAINLAKFGSLYGYPLQDQVWFQTHKAGLPSGSYFSLRYLTTGLKNYFATSGMRFTPVFPFVTLSTQPAQAAGNVRLFGAEQVPSVPGSMPLLFLLSLWGAVSAFRPRPEGRARLTTIPMVAAACPAGAVLIFGFLDARFVGDFLPLLVVGSAVGAADIWYRLGGTSRLVRTIGLSVVGLLAVFGVVVNTTMSITPTGWWSAKQAFNFVQFQKSVSDLSGHPLNGTVVRGTTYPHSGQLDELFLQGNCKRVWIYPTTGIFSWIPVGYKSSSPAYTLCRDLAPAVLAGARVGNPFGTGAVAGTGTQLPGIGAKVGFSLGPYDYNIYDLPTYSVQQAARAFYSNDPKAGVAMIERYNPEYRASTIEIPNVPNQPPVPVPSAVTSAKRLASTISHPFGTGAVAGAGTQLSGVGAKFGFSSGPYDYNVYDLADYTEQEAAGAIYSNNPTAGLAMIERYNPVYQPSTIEIPNVPNQPPVPVASATASKT